MSDLLSAALVFSHRLHGKREEEEEIHAWKTMWEDGRMPKKLGSTGI